MVGLAAATVMMALAGAAGAQEGHGLGGSMGCASPITVGDAVVCTYSIRNNSDGFGDTMRAHSAVSTTFASGGSVSSGNIFSSLAWVVSSDVGGALPTCVGGSGSGTVADPYVGVTSCDLPADSRLTSQPFSYYTAQAGDVGLLGVEAVYTATDLCDAPGTQNCPTVDLTVSPNSQTTVLPDEPGEAFTPGYWKNHQAQTTALLPITLGGYSVTTFPQAKAVFGAMNCGNSKPQSAIGCLAGHLLAAKLNVANGASTCIAGTITDATTFLTGGAVSGVTGIVYTGPSGTYSLTAAQRAAAVAIKDALDQYNNDLGC